MNEKNPKQAPYEITDPMVDQAIGLPEKAYQNFTTTMLTSITKLPELYHPNSLIKTSLPNTSIVLPIDD